MRNVSRCAACAARTPVHHRCSCNALDPECHETQHREFRDLLGHINTYGMNRMSRRLGPFVLASLEASSAGPLRRRGPAVRLSQTRNLVWGGERIFKLRSGAAPESAR
jgi:hypothetical protein